MEQEMQYLELSNFELEVISSQMKDFKLLLNLETEEDKATFELLNDLRKRLIGNQFNDYDLQFIAKFIVKFEKKASSEEREAINDLKQRVMELLQIDPVLRKHF